MHLFDKYTTCFLGHNASNLELKNRCENGIFVAPDVHIFLTSCVQANNGRLFSEVKVKVAALYCTGKPLVSDFDSGGCSLCSVTYQQTNLASCIYFTVNLTKIVHDSTGCKH